jgi:hypothetical protein
MNVLDVDSFEDVEEYENLNYKLKENKVSKKNLSYDDYWEIAID